MHRIAEAVVWVLGIFVVLFLGRIALLFNPSVDLSGFERGEIVGRIFGALTLGVVIRWVWIKLRKRGRVLSPWILVIAALALGSSLARDVTLIPPVGAPIDTYLEVGAPYDIGPAPADVAAQFAEVFDQAGSTATEVREIREAGTPVGYLLVANVGGTAADDFLADFESGFEENAGAEASMSTISAAEVLVGTGPDFAGIVWNEPPYAVVVYSLDVDSARALATSVMAAYR